MRNLFVALGLLAGLVWVGTTPASANAAGAIPQKLDIAGTSQLHDVHGRRRWRRHWHRPRVYLDFGDPYYYDDYYYDYPRYRYRRWNRHRWHRHNRRWRDW